jgi:hypothetical protein
MTDNPQHAAAEALFHEGNRYMQHGDFDLAERCFLDAVRVDADFAGGHANLGFVCERRGDATRAETCYRRSLELDPSYPETHLNLGVLLAARKRFHEAELAYTSALMLRPDSVAAWSNLGVLYACAKREREAEACYRVALNLDPAHVNARFNLGYLLLRRGAFAEGWECFDARDWYGALQAKLTFPRWRGEPLEGKSLLIGYEGGHGDMIQFCRYASVLKGKGASCIALMCHPPLKALFAQLAAVDRVIAFDEPLPTSGWDYWTPLLSVPYHCKTRVDSIPSAIPYLHAPPERLSRWQGVLPGEGLRVGLVWKGSPHFENDADRSLPSLAALAPLGTLAGITLISLQKGEGEDEAAHPPAGMRLLNLGPRMTDFADTAAIIAQLDLVICVDTAVAHLAGAMGKPCWILLPYYKTDWRWLKDRDDSPWYPRVVRLFRQTVSGEWSDVVADVVRAVVEFVERPGTTVGRPPLRTPEANALAT